MSTDTVTPTPKRTIRWWALIAALLVLAINAWNTQRWASLTGALSWYSNQTFLFDWFTNPTSHVSKATEVSPALAVLMNVDPKWRDVALSMEADRNPAKLLKDSKGKSHERQNWIRARFIHQLLPLDAGKRQLVLTEFMQKDSSNALYPCMLANNAFLAAGLSSSNVKGKNWQGISISHPAELPKAILYAQKVFSLPYFSDYATEYERDRMRHIKAPFLTEHQLARIEVREVVRRPIMAELRKTCKNYGSVMVYLAHQGQMQQARQLSQGWQRGIFRLEGSPHYDMMEVQEYINCIYILSCATAEVAKLDGDTVRAQRYSGYIKIEKQQNLSSIKADAPYERFLSQYGSRLSNIYVPLGVKLTQQSIEPIRTAEQAVFERITMRSMSSILGGLLVVLLVICGLLPGSRWQYSRRELGVAIALAVLPWGIYGLLTLAPGVMSRQYGPDVVQSLFTAQLAIPVILCLMLPIMWLSRRVDYPVKRQHMMASAFLFVILPLNAYLWFSLLRMLDCPRSGIWMGAFIAFGLKLGFNSRAWLLEWSKGLAVAVAALWIVLAFVAYPLFTAKDAAAWSRDTLLFAQNEVISPVDIELMKRYESTHMLRSANYGLLKDAGM